MVRSHCTCRPSDYGRMKRAAHTSVGPSLWVLSEFGSAALMAPDQKLKDFLVPSECSCISTRQICQSKASVSIVNHIVLWGSAKIGAETSFFLVKAFSSSSVSSSKFSLFSSLSFSFWFEGDAILAKSRANLRQALHRTRKCAILFPLYGFCNLPIASVVSDAMSSLPGLMTCLCYLILLLNNLSFFRWSLTTAFCKKDSTTLRC